MEPMLKTLTLALKIIAFGLLLSFVPDCAELPPVPESVKVQRQSSWMRRQCYDRYHMILEMECMQRARQYCVDHGQEPSCGWDPEEMTLIRRP
jgi:hypothetical protein